MSAPSRLAPWASVAILAACAASAVEAPRALVDPRRAPEPRAPARAREEPATSHPAPDRLPAPSDREPGEPADAGRSEAGPSDASPPLPVDAVTVPIPGDRPVEAYLGAREQPWAFVYMHGLCGDPYAFQTWASAVRPLGTLISLRGDQACEGRPGRSKWSFDYALTDRRISAALEAVDALRQTEADGRPFVPLRRDRVFLVGYSQGAHRAQWMVARFPTRFPRVALIAMSTEPTPGRLAGSERVLLMAGGRDARRHIHEGHLALAKAGLTSRYVELPGARHGDYGPDAAATMADALGWLVEGTGDDGGGAARQPR